MGRNKQDTGDIINQMKVAMSGFIVLWLLLGEGLAIPVGTACNSSIECGSKLEIERLACYGGKCVGAKDHNTNVVGKSCAYGYFRNNMNICQGCIAGCGVCTEATTCSSSNGCMTGYYYDSKTKSCLLLGGNCDSGSSPSECSQCHSGYFALKGMCALGPANCLLATTAEVCTLCESGKYWDTILKACLDGPSDCERPTDKDSCNVCNPGYYRSLDTSLTPSVYRCKAGPNKCVTVHVQGGCKTCKMGYYITSSKTCAASVANCMTATSPTTCLACIAGYHLHKSCEPPLVGCKVGLSRVACSQCKDGYYLSLNGLCIVCYNNCATCNGAGKAGCLTCFPGYKKVVYNCVPCMTPNCQSCGPTPNECIGCKAGYYRVSSMLGSVSTYSCVPCSSITPNCALCDGPATCISCKPGFYLMSPISCTASVCSPNCNKCSAATTCDTNGCIAGYYNNGGTCSSTLCEPNCVSCGGPSFCSTCANGFYKICKPGIANCEVHTENFCSACSQGFAGVPVSGGSALYSACISCNVTTIGYTGYQEACTSCALASTMLTCTMCAEGWAWSSPTRPCVNCATATAPIIGAVMNCKWCTVTDPNINCHQCLDFYVPNAPSPTTCSMAGGIANCKTYTYSGGAPACSQCMDGFAPTSFPATMCINTISIPNCKTYMMGPPLYCIQCMDGFAPSSAYPNIVCSVGLIANCKTYGYATVLRCVSCNTGYVLKADQTACYQISSATFPNCRTASGDNVCSGCSKGYYLGGCSSIPCVANCKTCASSMHCSQCNTGFYGSGGPIGWYSVCLPCMSYCDSCMSLSSCSTCSTGYYLDGSDMARCLPGPSNSRSPTSEETTPTCIDGYMVYSNNPCKPCTSMNCAVCETPEATTCITCMDGYWKDQITSVCTPTPCTLNCKTCTSTNTCGKCKDGYWKDPAMAQCTSMCQPNCLTCASVIACETCMDGYYLKPDKTCGVCDSASNGVKTCTKLMIPLGSTTLEIAGSKTITTQCVEGSFQTDVCDGPVAGCVITKGPDRCEKCAEGYWLDPLLFLCTMCMPGCLTCTLPTVCVACKPNYATIKDSIGTITGCILCTSGQYLNATGNACVACGSETKSSTCICEAGKIWLGSACVQCDSNCAKCKSPTVCETCAAGAYFDLAGKCVITGVDSNCETLLTFGVCLACQIGFYYDETNNVCKDCSVIPNCKVCSSGISCSVCATGFYLSGTSCAACTLPDCVSCSRSTLCDMCNDTYYWNSTIRQCTSCIPNCRICSNPTTCYECSPGYKLNERNTCDICPIGCASCMDTTGNCTSCMDSYYLDVAAKLCNPCGTLCKTCKTLGDDNCYSCVLNAALPSGKRIGPCTCLPGYLPNSTGACMNTTISTSVSSSSSTNIIIPLEVLVSILIFFLVVF